MLLMVVVGCGSSSNGKALTEERVVTIDENLLPTKSDVSATN